MDLSKAFDTIKYDIPIAELEAYGFFHRALLCILSYMKSRSQRIRVNNIFSSWKKITDGVLLVITGIHYFSICF